MFAHLSPEKLFSLAGKTVFITGGAGGIAGALANAYAAAGATLVLVDRNPAVVERAEALAAAGAKAYGLVSDITDDAAVADAIERTVALTGRLDVVVNVARFDERVQKKLRA